MYLDSAIIVKLFTAEVDSWFYSELVEGRSDIVVSNLSVPECRSAVLRKLDYGELDAATCETALSKINDFLFAGFYAEIMWMDSKIINRAAEFISQCHGRAPLRTLDALHISSCVAAGAFPLVTNDKIMRRAATLLGVPLMELPHF